MSNLGWYQLITKWSKAVGGPKVFLALVAASGYGIVRVAEAGGKKLIKLVKREKEPKTNLKVYSFTVDGNNSNGLKFISGDEFCVAASDGDSILIEKKDDNNNPYFVSNAWLKGVSNYGDI